jgi:hypothetical protein
VAPSTSELNRGSVLPSGGVDYAWGRDSNALYVAVGEAF